MPSQEVREHGSANLISFLQAVLAGLGFLVAGIPRSGLFAIGVLVRGILQIQGLLFIQVLIWIWTSRDATTALALTAYLGPVGVINIRANYMNAFAPLD